MESFEEGEKVALIGGGNPRNTFHIVVYLDRKNESQVILETDDGLPNPFEPFVTAKVEGLPLGGSSWSLVKLQSELRDLPLGKYCISGNEIIDVTNVGYFGSILNGKVVKRL